MNINGMLFNCELSDIINELRIQLSINGIKMFSKTIDSGDDIMVQCPYHKNGQEHQPSCGIRKSDGKCHCFRAGTGVITRQGVTPIEKLCEFTSGVEILNGNGDWEFAKFNPYGISQLWKILLTRDFETKEIYATGNHEWFIKQRKFPRKTEELHVGDYLEGVISNPRTFKIIPDAVIHGIIYGDGTRNTVYSRCRINKNKSICNKNRPLHITYTVRIPKFNKKKVLLPFFQKDTHWHISDTIIRGKSYWIVQSHKFDITHNYKMLPSTDLGRDYLMSFLAGYFACDGSIDLMRLYSSKVEDLQCVHDLFIWCGVSVRDINITKRVTNYLINAIGAELFIYPNSLPDEFFIVDEPRHKSYSRVRWKVVSVEPTDIYEPVYCCRTTTNSFVLAGNILTHNCFTCDKVVDLTEMIANVFGYTDPAWGFRWLLQNFATVKVEERKEIELDLSRTHTMPLRPRESVSDSELDSYRYTHPYLYERGLTDEIIERFDIGYDKASDSITFPVRYWGCINFGKTMFIARRQIKTKRFDLPKNMEKPLYGLYEIHDLMTANYFDDTTTGVVGVEEIYVCEGLFDCLRLWCNGKVAVAGFGCLFSDYQLNLLQGLPTRKLILALDNDKAGINGANKIRNVIKNKLVTQVIIPDGYKDIGELSDEQINSLEEVFI